MKKIYILALKILFIYILIVSLSFFISYISGFGSSLLLGNTIKINITLQYILFRNLGSLIINILGFFCLGITTLGSLIINGLILGATACGIFIKYNSFSEMLFFFLPHGLFEIPAFCLAAGIGFGGWPQFTHTQSTYKKTIFIIIPLWLIAGIIEFYYVFTKVKYEIF